MHANLMHAAGARLAQHHAGLAIVAESLERRGAILAFGGYLAHANLVADHLNGLRTLDQATKTKKRELLQGCFAFVQLHTHSGNSPSTRHT